MPIRPTYPGVYIEEVPSGVRTITGVSTSVAAFIGYFKKGPMDKAIQVLNMGDFEREFGGITSKSEVSYAIQQFFLNGGTEAWIVRIAIKDNENDDLNAKKAKVIIKDASVGATALEIEAINEGDWGNKLRIDIDYSNDDSTLFNLGASEYVEKRGKLQLAQTEIFRNLSMDPSNTRFVETVVNDDVSGSKLIHVSDSGVNLPLQTGTMSGDLSTFPMNITDVPMVDVTIGTEGPFTAELGASPSTLKEARSLLETAIRTCKPDNPAFANASVESVQNRLRILAGPTSPDARVVFSAKVDVPADNTTVTRLKLDESVPNSAIANVQEYTLGVTSNISNTGQGGGTEGKDGSLPDGISLIGNLSEKTGIYALEDVDLFNILCIPRTAIIEGDDSLESTEATSVLSVANNYCEKRRAFFIMDTPINIDELQKMKEWMEDNLTLRHKNAAIYFPRINAADPLNEFRLRSFGASGTMAGLYARIDSTRGVWKAPAGTEATLINVQALDYTLTDDQNGVLNPLGINCIRNFPVYGNVSWGARTLDGSDQQSSDWKYISVRRVALFLEESLYRGTKWVVFEPNDEPLWAQIRLNIGSFMHSLFKRGAFQGTKPTDAYFVKCDSETTTQDDINKGIVNIIVGFAPLKPAEFVIIKISQMAGKVGEK